MTISDYSPKFYRNYANRYAEVSAGFIQSVYSNSSHPKLRHDWDLWDLLIKLSPGRRGLDAGCGAGARDVFHGYSEGYDVVGIDAIEENIQVARVLHEEISDRVFVADLKYPLPFDDESFDFVSCNAVIQHIDSDVVHDVVLPHFARVLRPGGVLQLMFKVGQGISTVFDKDFGTERTFRLYGEKELLNTLETLGLSLIEAESPNELGGLLYFTDTKAVDHCVFFVRKLWTIPSLKDPSSVVNMVGDKRTGTRLLLKSKIGAIRITDDRLEGMDCIVIDAYLMEKADFWDCEKVLVSDLTSGYHYETYVVEGERLSGVCETRGTTTRLSTAGNLVEIMSFNVINEPVAPRIIRVDENNRYLEHF